MKKACIKSPDSCVIIEMEPAACSGYRKAVLLNEIKLLGSLKIAAKTYQMDA
jgi:molybdenum-dependent DNA-binding transcriptional regulator ModE